MLDLVGYKNSVGNNSSIGRAQEVLEVAGSSPAWAERPPTLGVQK